MLPCQVVPRQITGMECNTDLSPLTIQVAPIRKTTHQFRFQATVRDGGLAFSPSPLAYSNNVERIQLSINLSL